MKKRIIYLFITLLVFNSCEDKLDVIPYDGLTDEQLFSTSKGFDDAMKGVYAGFRLDGFYGANDGYIISPEVLSDNLTLNMAGRQTAKDLFEWRNTAVDESFSLYANGYYVISRANNILGNIDKLPDNAFKNNIKAEALAVRALVHFDIAKVYCKIPTQSVDAKTSLGIYYAKEYKPSLKVRRAGTTVDQVYTNVIQDLKDALPLINASNGAGRLNKAAVCGLLARVYLYYGDYANVETYANLAVANGAIVSSRANYPLIWTDQYAGNVLFKIRIVDIDRVTNGVPYSQTVSGAIKSEYVCAYAFYQLFQATDIRLSASIRTSVYSGKTYNNVAKHLGRVTGNANVTDGKYLRTEEVILSKAEALYHMVGREADALAALNEVRSQRYSGFVSPDETGAALLAAIILERRLELAFEGDRFFTLKRLGLPLSRGSEGEFADGTGTAPVVQSYPASGFRWQQPIPQGAIDANPEMAQDQNPGY